MRTRARLTRKEAENIRRDLAFLRLAHARPVGPETGEREQGPSVVEGEPDGYLLAVHRVVLGEAGEGHQAAMLRTKPAFPMRAVYVADVSGPAVRLHAEQLLKSTGLPFASSF